jgi:hypothetical protein
MDSRPRALAGALLSALALAFAQPAHAQIKDSIGVELFEPAIGWPQFLNVAGAGVVPHKQFALSLYFDYQRDPFTLEQKNPDGSLITKAAIVRNGLDAYLSGAFGIRDVAQVGIGVPIALSLTSTGAQFLPSGATTGDFSTTAFGDVYLEGKFQLVRGPWGSALAVAPGFTLPTATHKYAGEENVSGRFRVIGSFEHGRLAAAANVGVLIRDPAVVASGDPPLGGTMPTQIEIGSQLLYGGALSYALPIPRLRRPIHGIVELFGRHGFDDFLDSAPMEADAALRIPLPHALAASVGGGVGIVRGVGSPVARGFVGVSWSPDYRDRDGDGIPDMDDLCPDQPEDRDGYKDEDGCPDPDNDGDGIPDEKDKCPNEAEDFDSFQDEDGCPDPDNDKDGIPDIHDACPNAPEDGKGRFPNDGCPEDVVDTDGDGIPDVRDKCPDEPEDKDGFQDEDGCPDPDNDKDGVPDLYDECPNEPEDADGFQDEDGCPDPDNDHDGIPDEKDKCPNEPETINGVADDDGCPDIGPVHVKVGETTITVDEPVAFTRSKLVHTAWLLDQLALTLKGHVEIAKLRIDAHTQPGENDAEATRRANAVRDYLIKKGVAADRLSAEHPLGPGPQVAFTIEARKDAKPKKAAPAKP